MSRLFDTPPSLDELVHHLRNAAAEARGGVPTELEDAPTSAGAAMSNARLHQRLREITKSARLLGYERIPVKRSVHHLVWLMLRDIPAPTPQPMPAGTLKHVLIVRTAPIRLLERCLQVLDSTNPGCRATIVCHHKDVEALDPLRKGRETELLVYPRLEPYHPPVLRELIASSPRTDWDAAIALDNSPTGFGDELFHVWSAFEDGEPRPMYVFNANGELYPQSLGRFACDPATARLVRDLLNWLANRAHQNPSAA